MKYKKQNCYNRTQTNEIKKKHRIVIFRESNKLNNLKLLYLNTMKRNTHKTVITEHKLNENKKLLHFNTIK